jgi:hypothetical protein
VWTGITIAILIVASVELAVASSYVLPPGGSSIGMDYAFYRDLGQRWVDTGQFYLPRQLEGPYEATLMVDNLYPPSALFLFAPLLVVPAVLWWAVPMAVLGWVIAALRPRPMALPLLALILVWPRTQTALLFGNTDLWIAAAVGAGLVWGWPLVMLAIKPTFLIFCVIGVRRRPFWIAAAVFAAASIPMAALWLDYGTAIRNMSIDPDYSVGSLPLVLSAVIAWLFRRRDRDGITPAA